VREPLFLSFEQVAEIHQESITKFGGTPGLRDRGASDSAIFHPKTVYFYGASDLFEIAAAYAFHIAGAQAFLDGNKRIAIGAALIFLEGNGVSTICDADPIYGALIAIAEKRMTKSALAELFRDQFRQ